MVKIFSDKTNKYYKTIEEAQMDEEALVQKEQEKAQMEEKAKAARREKAAEVEAAQEAVIEAQKKYRETLEDFCKKYGPFHQTINVKDMQGFIPSIFDLFNFFN